MLPTSQGDEGLPTSQGDEGANGEEGDDYPYYSTHHGHGHGHGRGHGHGHGPSTDDSAMTGDSAIGFHLEIRWMQCCRQGVSRVR